MEEKQKHNGFKVANLVVVTIFLCLGINCCTQTSSANIWALKSCKSFVQDHEKMTSEEILRLERKLAAHPFRDLKIGDQVQIDSTQYCIVKNKECFRWSISDSFLFISKSDIFYDYEIIQHKDRMIIMREKFYGRVKFVFEKYL